MLKVLVIAVVFTLVMFFGISAAQSDPVTITIGESCDSIPRLSIPIYMNNPDSVGSFTIRIILPDPSWLVFDPDDPDAADTTGSLINHWPWFHFWVDEPDTIVVNAARIFTGEEAQCVPAGEGLIFTIHPVILETADDCQRLRFDDGCYVFDETQYDSYPLNYVREEACSGCDPSWLHGDMDHSGDIGLTDIMYMIAAYRGTISLCAGCRCTGDADANGIPIELSDLMTLIANYRTGEPVMLPCE